MQRLNEWESAFVELQKMFSLYNWLKRSVRSLKCCTC
ncbi:MbeD/MobD family mobilization/exclusion protein [Escherichia coli]